MMFFLFYLALFVLVARCIEPLRDAQCAVEDVEKANVEQLHSILMELIDTPFFRLFRVPLDRPCSYWNSTTPNHSAAASATEPDAGGLCSGGAAPGDDPFGVDVGAPPACSLERDGVPPSESAKRREVAWQPFSDAVDRTISRVENAALQHAQSTQPDCDDENLPTFWLDLCGAVDDSSASETADDYISLPKNPERWTGYNGTDVWRAVYEENCFSRATDVEAMCYEERVLYRLLSGMHASINIHISKYYYPPRKGKRVDWEPNSKRYIEQFEGHPERLKNLHFAFVVLLRAVHKAGPTLVLTQFAENKHDPDAQRTALLVRRLVDSAILKSCTTVFSAFDESLLFQRENGALPVAATLKREFKGVFRNISSLLDCVTCQTCKLHGKLQLLGLGTALKILLLPDHMVVGALDRQETVALFNTLAKFSEAIAATRELTQHYRDAFQRQQAPTSVPPQSSVGGALLDGSNSGGGGAAAPVVDWQTRLDTAVGAVAALARAQRLSPSAERALLGAALAREPGLLALTWHYARDADTLAALLPAHAASLRNSNNAPPSTEQPLDAVVVGAGLSGLTVSLTLLDRGARVLLLEREAFFGGNSAWASSGVNAVLSTVTDDSVELYRTDTLQSGGLNASSLVDVLTLQSGDALMWLRQRSECPLPIRGQLGGHSAPRTYRPDSGNGLAGSEIILALQRRVEAFSKPQRDGRTPPLTVHKKARVTALTRNASGAVVGVEYALGRKGSDETTPQRATARNVVLATGGFAADRGADSLLAQFRPDLLHLASTNGRWARGDGVRLADSVGAKLSDLRNVQVCVFGATENSLVQVHPTAFVRRLNVAADGTEAVAAATKRTGDANAVSDERRTLCAEILRGVGGVLLDARGQRFVNELDTRKNIVEKMRAHTDSLATVTLPDGAHADEFVLLLGASADRHTTHVALYQQKQLLARFDTHEALAKWMRVDADGLRATLRQYDSDAARGADPTGRTTHGSVPLETDLPFYAGLIAPALHYTMGGVRIDTSGRVLHSSVSDDVDDQSQWIDGLWAVGEVAGGIHGHNRLGGNALTECVVFGRAAGLAMPISAPSVATSEAERTTADEASGNEPTKEMSAEQVAQHNSEGSCYVILFGQVYDFTDFLEEHPAGPEAILEYAGQDGSEKFEAVHSLSLLDDFEPIAKLKK